jgi:hypothetical protein
LANYLPHVCKRLDSQSKLEANKFVDYDRNDALEPDSADGKTPRSPELRQFDAFLRRELPRTIRKMLEAALESKMGPIEETLKNDLENMVRDAQDKLTRSYLRSAEPSDMTSGAFAGPSNSAPQTQSPSLSQPPTAPMSLVMEDLPQFLLPPDTIPASLLSLDHVMDNTGSSARQTDSAYYSLSENPILDGSWFDWTQDESLFNGINEPIPNYSFEDPQPEEYDGKGKARARQDALDDGRSPTGYK